ncbi:MAG: hypothetical protein K1X88_10025 [Nannocystaceae bacterium]|nr:hypothetical protein [Nannocystaceae bacterium]
MSMMLASVSYLMLALGSADAEPAAVVVLPPEAPALTPDRRALVHDTLWSSLPGEEFSLVERERVAAAVRSRGDGCGSDAACRSAVAQELGARFVIATTVSEPTASDYALVLSVHDLQRDRVTATFEETCTICSEADLRRLVQERTLDAKLAIERALVPEDAPPQPRPATTTPTPATKPAPAPKRPSPLPAVGWALTGAGIAGTLGGVAMLAMIGRDAGCPADPRGGPCIPLVYHTAIPGAVTAAVGVALLGTGVGLVVAGRKRGRVELRAAASGRGVMLRGRF